MRNTPCYVFDIDRLRSHVMAIRGLFGSIPLTFSIKANTFIMPEIVDLMDHVEVCSPGELSICEQENIPGGKIIYSGVMKEEADITRALSYPVDIITAESIMHMKLIQAAAKKTGHAPRVILRLSSGNQFGMDQADIFRILEQKEEYPDVEIYGYHFYSGTQKKKPEQIRKDIEELKNVIEKGKNEFGFIPSLVEYGPGLATEYFKPEAEQMDRELLESVLPEIRDFSREYPVGIEMGRFIATPCGKYYSTVKDIKTTGGIHYVIMDGGIHHLKYYGQMMAMNIPPITQTPEREEEEEDYCLCGSLCTVADVLIKKVTLKKLQVGDVISFDRCGAYSVTEASALFLSRNLPAVYLYKKGELKCVRDSISSWTINTNNMENK